MEDEMIHESILVQHFSAAVRTRFSDRLAMELEVLDIFMVLESVLKAFLLA